MTRRRVTHDEKVDRLHQLDVFRHCTRDELARIAAICTDIELVAGSVLCRQGELGAEFFVIVLGDAAVDVAGTRVATLGRGSFFGEHALLEHSPRNATVTAITPLRVLVFNRAEFNTMLLDAPHAVSDMLLRGQPPRQRRAQPATCSSARARKTHRPAHWRMTP